MRPTVPAALLGLLALSACTVGPDYQKPDVPMAQQWKPEPPFRPGMPNDASAKGEWWTIFQDTKLDELEQSALSHSQTLEAAAARLEQARAVVRVDASALYPSLALGLNADRAKISADRPLLSSVPNISTVQNDFVPTFQVRYEADLFGGVRRQVESARASAAQAAADLENARLVLTSEVAADYFSLRELDIEIHVIDQGIHLQRDALQFVSARHDLGDASGLDLAQQQALLDSTTTQIDLLRNQRGQYEHALASLTGAPAPAFAIQSAVLELSVPGIPLDLPSDVLERRPDVASAERAVAAANAQIGVAKAAFFPSVPLFANYGRESNAVANLFTAPSALWSFGLSASQSIFDAGRNQGNLDFARAGYNASVANYRQTVLTAFQEVEDGLVGLGTLERASREAGAAVRSAQRVLDLANDRYAGGVATYLDVITAQQSLLTNQRQAAQIRGQQMVTAVYLVKALGGGWSDKSPALERPSGDVGLLE